MSDHIRPPWTPEQVTALNGWQSGPVHPFTCRECRAVLRAEAEGWVCPNHGCGYRQAWAHGFMADPEILEGILSWNPGWEPRSLRLPDSNGD